ncbi:Cleavage stimulation factor subunit 2 tau variant [Echinococcus granulosus]|uniref:Cleavage stimulation factor subunit 2 tau variant n=1 Tax=Echinococcus granulosus TaxID=6210 RepID=W6UYZ3_ECHGR|nr:Cleavage stimulation factor subunit 2 tau variant [Echinococcus granulosus]EUB58804.1 Cleavage stimulation factor subunit 2 tau variant [Echinococcus granulosus]
MQSASIVQGKESAEKTARSIFVGNIPYEATEEKLVELFSKAGPVVSFRLVYDRESGKPKGYGFCEYANPAIAASALRNLQNIEFNGRPLRIGAAAGEQNSAEIALTNPSVGPPLENPYGNPVDPAKAPEAISRAVASLPPEQMYELMKQMKLCIQNNPNEARNMLLQNPQLAYALLQAQVVMKIVDPKVAIAMLNRTHDQIPPMRPENVTSTMCKPSEPGVGGSGDASKPPQQPFPATPMNGNQFSNQPSTFPGEFPPEQLSQSMGGPAMYGGFQPPQPQQPQPHQIPGGFPHLPHPSPSGPLGQPSAFPVGAPQPGVPLAPTTVQATSGIPSLDQLNPAISAALMAGTGGSVTGLPQKEQEKLDLIMQVLSLSEESIALLPEDEQRSIRILKEQSRRFAFFDKVELNIGKDERAFQDLPVTCVSSGGGYLWLGDVDGFMHCLDATFMFASFRAHNAGPVRLCRQVPGVESHLVVTVGVSSDDSTSGTRKEEERVCVWNTKKWSLTSKTSFPVCCRSVRTTATTAATASATLDEVVCLEVASTMDIILLGHTSGAVQLIKGDITSDRQCRRLILHEFPSPVTNLHYVAATPTSTTTKRHKGRHVLEQTMPESDSGSVSSASPLITKPTPSSPYIYAASENKLVSIKLGKKDEPVRTAVYFYDLDGRGPCLAIVGNKQAIAVYKNYLVSIRCNRPEANQLDFPDAQSSVSLFEYRNKFIGGEFFLPWAHSIITGFGGLFVLCVEEGSKIVELIEKDTQSRLDILFARKSFNLALGIAESDNYSEEELAHIHRRYADHLFNQKQYDLAVKEYIQTIGTVEASYVVLRFLESGLITHLVRYLEALIESGSMVHGRLTKDHTALLLNSYARLDDRERIDAFLDRLASQAKVSSEFYPCINVLRRAGYPHQALRLAQITSNHTDCIRILTEDLKDAVAALKEINSLPFDQSSVLPDIRKLSALFDKKTSSVTTPYLLALN